jgi:hypothetical protein
MTKKEFILQGFTARTHRNALRELFGVPDVERALISVAFVSEGGVQQIEEELTAHAARLTILAGIRNEITSHQGLTRLHSLGGTLYTVDTGTRHILFHPKLYLVRGKAQARLLVGSANLTLGGLNNNIEAGMLLDLDLANPADRGLVEGIEVALGGLPQVYPSHVVKIDLASEIDALLDSGRVVDETAIPPPRVATSGNGPVATDTVPRIKLRVTALRQPLRRAKGASKAKSPAESEPGTPVSVATATVGIEFELVWQSKPLTRRDLSIPNAAGTHATGSVNLDKGQLPEDVDHRHYFRDVVFSALLWTTRSATVEEAFAKFQLVVMGIGYGDFDLRVGHTMDTTSAAYTQRNAMTRLSWGPMRQYIARPELIGRVLALYRDRADPTRFVLEID